MSDHRSDRGREQDRRWAEFVDGLQHGAWPSFDDQWALFRRVFADRRRDDGPPVVWSPGEAELLGSNLAQLMAERGFADFTALHDWSVGDRGAFWEAVVERLGIVFAQRPQAVLDETGGAAHPVWFPGAEMNIVSSCFDADPDRPAVVSGREGSRRLEVTTFGELRSLVDRVASGLVTHGFQEGDGIALYMPMNLECVAAYLGVVEAGCSVVSIADSFSAEELAKRLQIAGASGIITVSSFVRGGKTIELYDTVCAAGAPRAVVLHNQDGDTVELRRGDLDWSELVAAGAELPARAADPHAVTNVLFSSGTTGTPKAIPWTQLTPIKCAMDGHFHHDIRAGDVVAWPTNIGWMMGPWLIYAALINRAAVALYEGLPTGEGFYRFVDEARVTMLGVVPSLVRAWRGSPNADSIQWRHVRVLSSTGEPSNREDYLWLMSRAGYRAPVIEYCGGTEIGGGYITGTVVQPASPATFTTPALGIELVVLGEDGDPVEEGEMGEAYLVPPSIGLSQRLLNRDHDVVYFDGCPRGPEGEVLRRHGDQLERLRGGFFKALGRADDTMNLGGIKVSSRELEALVDGHDAVYESAAVGVQPGGEGAEKLVVFVVLAAEIDPARLRDELASMVAGRLNPLFKIHDVVVVDSLPRTASNKLMRRTLRARYVVDVGGGSGA